MPDVTIRRATSADVDAIGRVVQSAYARYVPMLGMRPAPMDADYRLVVSTALCWVAQLGEPVVGVVVATADADHLLVENVAVAPSAQGHGVGNLLLHIAERYAREQGVPETRLYTNEAMTDNLAFYARRGYRETARRTEHGFRRVFLAKPLD